MARARARFVCQHCGFSTARPLGRCTECGEWDALVEEVAPGPAPPTLGGAVPRPLCEVSTEAAPRLPTGVGELDRVLGGGLVPGSLVLLGGEPGVGKSTLLLHALEGLARAPATVLYVSGEESAEQTALRARRLGVGAPRLLLLCETRLERILDQTEVLGPRVLAVDSVQTVHAADLGGVPGSVGQVREAAARLLALAKGRGVSVVLVGHVTKEGGLAGPKTLEHAVDVVLYFEGERTGSYRLLRATKNRFGATSEIGVFEMHAAGLREVPNPSASLLAERPRGAPGSVVVAAVQGSRPLLVEVQALVARAAGIPRRAALGVDPHRVALLLAVVERRLGLSVADKDVFVNVAGGLALDEPACDLGVLAAIASSARGRPVGPEAVCFGEVGLAGEVRAVGRTELRLAEAAKLGFRRCVLPEPSRARTAAPGDLALAGVRDVGAAVAALDVS